MAAHHLAIRMFARMSALTVRLGATRRVSGAVSGEEADLGAPSVSGRARPDQLATTTALMHD